jgi:hypothetical protein
LLNVDPNASAPSAPAGYSGTPLPRKLGIKEGHRIALENAPAGFARTLGELPAETVMVRRAEAGAGLDLVLFFTTEADELRREYARLSAAIHPAGMFWVSWPKRAAKVKTDLTEDVVRAIALERGMVDTKVCAVDETWSGLRLVYRLKDRPKG